MRKHLSITAALGIAFAAITGTANADNSFSLHLEPGLAQPLTAPQNQIYDTGMVLGAKGLFALDPNLAVGPFVSALYLPRAVDDGQNAGTVWQFGASARVQGDRNVNNTDPLFSVFNPWIDLDAGLAATGNLLRPAFDVGVGAETPLDQNHIVWFGPFLRFTHVFQSAATQDGNLLDPHDVSILQGGISFSFDAPTNRKVERRTMVEYVPEVRTVVRTLPPFNIVVRPEQKEKFELTERVYFDFDSANLRWESRDKLDTVARKLNEHPGFSVEIEGHASADGQLAHNVDLSAHRASVVRQYLADHGVDNGRLIGLVKGVRYPVAPNTSKEGRERNRRVEFVVTFTAKPVDTK